MRKITDNFCGYLKVGSDVFAYSVSNNIVTLLPAQSDPSKRNEVYDRVCSRNTDLSEYLFGEDYDGTVAILRNGKFAVSPLGLNEAIKFATPIIIKACGNAAGFFNMLTEPWDKFLAITFLGGNINALYNPQLAVEPSNVGEYLNNKGSQGLRLRPWENYTHSIGIEIDGEKALLMISISGNKENSTMEQRGAYNLGTLNSYIRLTFEKAQSFEQIEKYYVIVKKLVSILTLQNNITFDVYLSQKNSDNKYFQTGTCKIFDSYENYSIRPFHRVIPIYNVFSCLPNLINMIAKGEADSLITLLPEDNRRINQIPITSIQDLCTALEVAYGWSNRGKEKDVLIEELKKAIKKAIRDFAENHVGEISVYDETTISSAFQYLSYTLKQKILTLYNENHSIIDAIVSKCSLPQVNATNIAAFVNLRNDKTHSGTVNWGNNVDIYPALLALAYACLFKYAKLPDEIIEATLLQVF